MLCDETLLLDFKTYPKPPEDSYAPSIDGWPVFHGLGEKMEDRYSWGEMRGWDRVPTGCWVLLLGVVLQCWTLLEQSPRM
jgi:hypothetical protein